MAQPSDLREEILCTALVLAEKSSWEAVRLHDIADHLHVNLCEIAEHYAEKDQLIDAWFDRADRAMLNRCSTPNFAGYDASEKVYHLLCAWLDALYSHQAVTHQMIASKLELGHLHIQFPALMRISRTVQWLREAAARKETHLPRAIDESLLTGIYLCTFRHWLRDTSPQFEQTRAYLWTTLARFERLRACRLVNAMLVRSDR